MKEQIFAALAAHTAWKERLYKAIDSGIIDPPPSVIELDNACVFGKWLYGNEIPAAIKLTAQYEAVRQIHAQFHKLTAQIALLAVTGNKEKAKELLSDGSEYIQLSDRLRSALLDLARVSQTLM
ncbi:MAG: CZB domain-containing protein [Pseudanabaenaceae cyanobacterium SKYGB_i_bin29]|nr:CZB domain-containing protein [Pseudanabaenaceae cyanobacterium SKYG29]MDW8420946.1 CZB domain-containing protein [Pseudanabaenaceae cyanobacterium SKYGB_i_bin29]